MPGIRTSITTTSGLRRSTSEIASAPSEASPITRMCGARLSERRSPSRTTSWSSTISVVISGVDIAARFYGGGGELDSESQLLGRFGRSELDAPTVANAVLAGEHAHLLAQRL